MDFAHFWGPHIVQISKIRPRCNFIFFESRHLANNMTNPSFPSCPRPPGNIESMLSDFFSVERRQNGITADSQSSKKARFSVGGQFVYFFKIRHSIKKTES